MWTTTAIALLGTYMNAQMKRNGFILWMFSNSVFCIWNLTIEQYAQSFLFGIYLLFAVFGYVNWGKKKDEVDQLKR